MQISKPIYDCCNSSVLISDVPMAPDAPQVDDITTTTCTVSWSPPSDDGGSPVTGYYIERKSNISPRWLRVNKAPVSELVLPMSDLLEGTEYQYRVIAVNKKGESQPSKPSDNFVAKNPYGTYSSSEKKCKTLYTCIFCYIGCI